MLEDSFENLVGRIDDFDWNPGKAEKNRRKHGIDFEDAIGIFYGPTFLHRSDRNEEARWKAIGKRKAAFSPWCSRGEMRPSVSSRHAAREEMSDEPIIKRKWGDRRKGRTDWAAVDALTDEEIGEAVRNDPDAVPLDVDWSKAVLAEPPKKTAISIRLDDDVLDFFKSEGPGYQRRINAVLRSFMDQKKRA
ncbi:BrnA antitoxin family protein [Rhodovulum sp. PH10]|uniref:BrnA antitoxin family protein n=1 Tax=Rhodovulum sp. PH10 TaxID=1187851 RepID=UPI0009FCF908|nr:BrnA antitoxin family protein [Rhodovulum sp. PH10]